MTTIVWDEIGDRVFETGLDRGVLYFPDGGGVPWNGLLAVSERPSSSIESVYFDGVKFNDIVIGGDFTATLRAFTYPDEFLEFEGIIEEQSGLYIADQQQSLFHLSYRTKTGNDIDGVDQGYKIHLLWNLTAIPSGKSYRTISDDISPVEFEWSLTSIPEEIDKYRPTSHVILDSRRLDPWLLEDIESFLYGNSLNAPILPSLKGFISFVRKWGRIIIIDNGDGTWTATTQREGLINMLNSTTFEILEANAVYLTTDTYEISSTEKNEEDII